MNKLPVLTIFTPTYNRREDLCKLKSSLDKQTNKNFEWIIVDDGSTDNTEKEIKIWQNQGLDYNLIFIRQLNQGKHIAFNIGVSNSNTNWFLCVDSDDTLTPQAIDIVVNDTKHLPNNYVGLVYPRIMNNKVEYKSWKRINYQAIDIIDLHDLYKIKESTIVLKKEIIKDIPFPKFEGENYLPESWLYQKLISRGNFLAINTPFYNAEYLKDGLTKNVWKMWQKNPNGVLSILNEKYAVLNKYRGKHKLIGRLKCIINLNSLCMATSKNILEETPSAFLSIITYLPSLYFYKKRYS